MIKGKSGLVKLNNASSVILRNRAIGANLLPAKLLGVYVTGGTTTDTTVTFKTKDGSAVKTLTSSSGAISNTDAMVIGESGITTITLATTGDHSSTGIAYHLVYESQ